MRGRVAAHAIDSQGRGHGFDPRLVSVRGDYRAGPTERLEEKSTLLDDRTRQVDTNVREVAHSRNTRNVFNLLFYHIAMMRTVCAPRRKCSGRGVRYLPLKVLQLLRARRDLEASPEARAAGTARSLSRPHAMPRGLPGLSPGVRLEDAS